MVSYVSRDRFNYRNGEERSARLFSRCFTLYFILAEITVFTFLQQTEGGNEKCRCFCFLFAIFHEFNDCSGCLFTVNVNDVFYTEHAMLGAGL